MKIVRKWVPFDGVEDIMLLTEYGEYYLSQGSEDVWVIPNRPSQQSIRYLRFTGTDSVRRGKAQAHLFYEEAMYKYDAKQCPVCDAALHRTEEVVENVKIKTEAACSGCCLYADVFAEGVASQTIGFYIIAETWQTKPDKPVEEARRERVIAEAKVIRAHGGWPQIIPGEEAFSKLVRADWLQDRSIAPETEEQLRA